MAASLLRSESFFRRNKAYMHRVNYRLGLKIRGKSAQVCFNVFFRLNDREGQRADAADRNGYHVYIAYTEANRKKLQRLSEETRTKEKTIREDRFMIQSYPEL